MGTNSVYHASAGDAGTVITATACWVMPVRYKKSASCGTRASAAARCGSSVDAERERYGRQGHLAIGVWYGARAVCFGGARHDGHAPTGQQAREPLAAASELRGGQPWRELSLRKQLRTSTSASQGWASVGLQAPGRSGPAPQTVAVLAHGAPPLTSGWVDDVGCPATARWACAVGTCL